MSSAIASLPDYPNPLQESYTYHTKCPTAPGKYIMGVDEAGRGPALGPLVYAVAFCPAEYKEKLDDMGFNDSKQLTAETRSSLLESLSSDPDNLGWAVRVLSPQDLSAKMLQRPAINLNVQSQAATVHLISLVQSLGIEISELYVDALGPPEAYQRYLSAKFPSIENIVVEAKADAKWKIVGAASVAAKVTRDAWIEGWVWAEGRGSPSGNATSPEEGDVAVTEASSRSPPMPWMTPIGSGYPSDPNTKAWIQSSIEPTFGYPSIARFSWATIKVKLDQNAHRVTWTDDGHTIAKSFQSVKPSDKGRCAITRELAIRSVGSL
ncbi:hypothetical protein FRB99_006066 [Tulasnella sp. 403]|nr:hypothetical protein FRB99_006066 [Tulasnella sp. 403]